MIIALQTMQYVSVLLCCAGVRGEVYVQVKVELIQDQHRFKQSSFGVQFYCCEEPYTISNSLAHTLIVLLHILILSTTIIIYSTVHFTATPF